MARYIPSRPPTSTLPGCRTNASALADVTQALANCRPDYWQGASGVLEFRGVGTPVAKSAELSSLSVQPFIARLRLVVFDMPAAGAVSEQFVVPYPRTSITSSVGQSPTSGVVLSTSATLPFVADMLNAVVAWSG